MKRCTKCKQEKELNEFSKCAANPDDLSRWCKKCHCNWYKTTLNGRFRKCQDKARARGIRWKLTKEQFVQFWQVQCHYCNDKLETVGLDRIDSSQGYTIENVVPCCTTCNRMKSDFTKSEFLSNCEKIANNSGVKNVA